MKRILIALSLAAGLVLPALAAAADPAPVAASPHTFTGNFGLYSEYRFRAIAQTFKKPAIQGGFDYSHASGLYLGNWNSNVNEGAGYPGSNLEMDFYGGWKPTWGDWGLDIGGIYYSYPGSDAIFSTTPALNTVITNPKTLATHTGAVNNKEVYLGGSWKFLSLKYYHSTGDYFSQPGTKGSHYLDLAANFDLGNGWGINGHLGSFRLKNWSIGTDATNANYNDWKLGVTKDISGWVLAASYLATSGKGSCDSVNPGYYCLGNKLPVMAGVATKNAANGTALLSVSKTF
ncbi:MAG: TorF family putative porin [Proteobacteria bacterium]|nr:TorF family putative porin [Pseudomonadota bacterium]